MPLYLVSYDVAEKNSDEYKALGELIGNLGSLEVLYSEYAVPFTGTALELANKINAYLKGGDHLLVSELFRGGNPPPVVRGDLVCGRKTFDDFMVKHARIIP